MSELEFTHAPVSEVILGITFEKSILNLDKIFEFSQLLRNEYPIIEIKPPLGNQRLEEFKLITEVDNEKTGPFRIFQRSNDKKYLVQYQSNKLFFNWVRKDTESVGNYPGFSFIKEKYDSIFDKLIGLQNNQEIAVNHYELTYQDRVEWENFIPNLNDVHEIINLSTPPTVSDSKIKNIFTEYSYDIPSINGFCKLDINTGTALDDKQILKFQNTIRGSESFDNKNRWFKKAHDLQVEAFKKTFKPNVLNQWK